MNGRRASYGALLLLAAVLHLAYGQYVTLYILLFVLSLPVLSVLLSLPAILRSRADLNGGSDVQRGRPAAVNLKLSCSFFLPPDVWKLKIERQNLFLERRPERSKLRIFGRRDYTERFTPDTERLGTVLYRIRSARVCDYLGLFAIPVRKGPAITLTVLPNAEKPVPMPELVEPSERIMKPKPYGFSEEHELRPYREGDAVNLIHWKLTEKMDETIIREPQTLIRKSVVLTMDRFADYACEESVLEQLRCLADLLNASGIPFLLYCGLETVRIGGDGDFERFLRAFLSEPACDEQAQSIAPGSDTLIYRIVPKKEARPS